MSEPLTSSEQDALGYLYGGGDEEIVCQSAQWVKTRYAQECLSLLHSGPQSINPGSRMVQERAKVEGRFGSCYTCEECIRLAKAELAMH